MDNDEQIDTIESLMNIVNGSLRRFGKRPAWRGHSNAEWEIKPEVFRKIGKNEYDESYLINTFKTQALSRHRKCPNADDYVGWLVLARHYGLPTRILDWSWSPLVAFYFAIQDNDQTNGKDGCLWALAAGKMNEAQSGQNAMFTPNSKDIQRFAKAAYGSVASEYLAKHSKHQSLAFVAPEIDLRVTVQQSVFTIHVDGTDLAKIDDCADWLTKFTIPHDKKGSLRKDLDRLGIQKAALFPDLGSLAEQLKSRTTKMQVAPRLDAASPDQ